MEYSFTCCGHENITAKHKTTLEFTKDKDLRLEGDCIAGVRADFELDSLKEFIKTMKNNNNKKITITMETIDDTNNEKGTINKNSNQLKDINNKNKTKNNCQGQIIEKINAEINPDFNSDGEMVIRKSDFISERTFAIKADKAAFGLSRDLIGFLKEKSSRIMVVVKNRL